MKYKGKECKVCGKSFKDDDDIVVCTECGTPHHRECYKINNRCINYELHEDNFDWNKKSTIEKERKKILWQQEYDEKKDYSGKEYEVDENDDEDYDYYDILGKKNTPDERALIEVIHFTHSNILYYFPVFARMIKYKVNTSFNLSCFLFPPLYFAYRKMWFWTVFSSVLMVIFFIPLMIDSLAFYGFLPENVFNEINARADFFNSLVEIGNILDGASRVFFAIYGNRLYFKYARKKIKKIKELYKGVDDNTMVEILEHEGGVNFFNIIVTLLALSAVFALVAYGLYLLLCSIF